MEAKNTKNIVVKYDVNQKIYFMSNNKVVSNFIKEVRIKIYSRYDEKGYLQRIIKTSYVIENGVEYKEEEVFSSKEELLASL